MARRHRPVIAFRRASLSPPTVPITPQSIGDAGAIIVAAVHAATKSAGGALPRPSAERVMQLSLSICQIADTDPVLFLAVEMIVEMMEAARARGEGA